ncbi:MAG: anaerobic sulfatase-maturation protein [Tannerellaceae bacterium]|jgi:uncharacterized protein|nr:anaerobic sulfatase-maturation protein [Tannerellaceae bacterium]
MDKKTFAPFAGPLYVMLKPVGATCNLRCRYCYYLGKRRLYPGEGKMAMTDELLDIFIRQYLEAQTQPEVLFTWHGGEPLLRGIDFYRRAMSLQKKYASGRKVDNCIQTNGTLLDDEWCRFLADNNFLVGISVDGPQALHDRYRRMHGGRPSFQKVIGGLALLTRHKVEFNAMATVGAHNEGYPLEFYRFFKQAGIHYIQFTPLVDMIDGRPAPWSVTPAGWGDFLIAIFDEWIKHDVGKYFVQYFEATLANWAGVQPGLCSLAKTCGHAGVMEFNGDVYSCDHFVFPGYKLGNIRSHTLTGMMYSEKQLSFGAAKQSRLHDKCKQCRYLFACNGECPKNRITTEKGDLNYLCPGYHNFFTHFAATATTTGTGRLI